MNKKRLYIFLIFIFFISVRLQAQDWTDGDPGDLGGNVPIPGILYFLFALLGIGIKKLYHARKKG